MCIPARATIRMGSAAFLYNAAYLPGERRLKGWLPGKKVSVPRQQKVEQGAGVIPPPTTYQPTNNNQLTPAVSPYPPPSLPHEFMRYDSIRPSSLIDIFRCVTRASWSAGVDFRPERVLFRPGGVNLRGCLPLRRKIPHFRIGNQQFHIRSFRMETR